MKTIVVSAVNIVEAGPLAILKDCLSYLSRYLTQQKDEYRVIAIVYKKELVDYPHIEYIETLWPKKRWINRLWYEYVDMKKISIEIGAVYLWFSLHDTTPNVIAERQAVYCHNALSFYKRKFQDLVFAPKMAVLSMFTKYIYRPNIHRNQYIVVQQEWFRKAMHNMFSVDRRKIIVALPTHRNTETVQYVVNVDEGTSKSFIYAASPNTHKNFEVICRAIDILERQGHHLHFNVYITVHGSENKYAKWLYRKWNRLASLHFIGFLSKTDLQHYYDTCDVLIYPSKAESWGLPISEFAQLGKPMLLADLPYAYETAVGSTKTAFFNPDNPKELADKMGKLLKGEADFLATIAKNEIEAPHAKNWEQLFRLLLKKEITDY